MKFQRVISILVLVIVVLAIVASASGVFLNEGPGNYQFKSLHGETVTIYGKGLYQYESAKLGPQARGQDVVTLFIAVPLLVISLKLSRKGSLRGRLLLTGTLGYFLYTYTQYTAISYNHLFLVYILLMATCLYAFILAMMSFDMEELGSSFNPKMPVKFIAGFQIFAALVLLIKWLADIIPALTKGGFPAALEHYTTIPVYSMDLGLVVPTFLLAAILLLKRRPFGFLLSSVMILKSITMFTALTAMGIGAILSGVKLNPGDLIVFPVFNLIAIYSVWQLLKNINTVGHSRNHTTITL